MPIMTAGFLQNLAPVKCISYLGQAMNTEMTMQLWLF